jgi:hypothetical protein
MSNTFAIQAQSSLPLNSFKRPAATSSDLPLGSQRDSRQLLATALAADAISSSHRQEEPLAPRVYRRVESQPVDLSASMETLSLRTQEDIAHLRSLSSVHALPINEETLPRLKESLGRIKHHLDQVKEMQHQLTLPESHDVATCRKLTCILDKNLAFLSDCLKKPLSLGGHSPSLHFPKGFSAAIYVRASTPSLARYINSGCFGSVFQITHETAADTDLKCYVFKRPRSMDYLRTTYFSNYEHLNDAEKAKADQSLKEKWDKRQELFRAEIQFLFALPEHPAIIQFLGLTEEGHLLLEYVSGGSLHEAIHQHLLTAPQQYTVAKTLACALATLHRNAIIHRDVKPGNVLLTAERQPKLTDFGLAMSKFTQTSLARDNTGSFNFMAPELLYLTKTYKDARVDTWAYGVLLFFMLTETSFYHVLWDLYQEGLPTKAPLNQDDYWKFLRKHRCKPDSLAQFEKNVEKILLQADAKLALLPLPPQQKLLLSSILRKCFKFNPENRASMQRIEFQFLSLPPE